MKFKIEKKQKKNLPTNIDEDLKTFTDLISDIGEVYATLLSNPKEYSEKGVANILVFLEDGSTKIFEDLLNLSADYTTINLKIIYWTHFWLHFQDRNKIVLDYLRNGYSLFDRGYIQPLQELIFKGKIKPTKESVWNYLVESQESLKRADNHIKEGIIDLYWAMVDAAQGALAAFSVISPSPSNVEEMLNIHFVKRKLLEKEHSISFGEVYSWAKKIEHREIFTISGKEYKELEHKAEKFIWTIHKLIKEESTLP